MSLLGTGALSQPSALARSAPAYINWTSIFGSKYQFEVLPIGTPLFRLPGVYVFSKLGAYDGLDVGYVGEAESLDDRAGSKISSHHKWERAREWGATHICVLIVPGPREVRLRIETELCRQFSPPLND